MEPNNSSERVPLLPLLQLQNSCATCGFLARKPAPAAQASSFYEMPDVTRVNGGGWWAFQVAGLGTHTVPWCAVGAFPILAEIRDICGEAVYFKWPATNRETGDNRNDHATPERTAAAKTVFNKDRPECTEWFQYIPGLSPEKHIERRHMLQLEQDRRRFEADLERDRKSFETRLFDIEQRSQEKWQTVGLRLAVAAIILAAAQVLTMTEDSLLWKLTARLWAIANLPPIN